jgi:hypothetical protein
MTGDHSQLLVSDLYLSKRRWFNDDYREKGWLEHTERFQDDLSLS